jgi:putative ABC transport system permease protein
VGIFGLVALALSSIGVYGVLSESVAQRTHEIGIRLALGANPRELMKLILGQALKLTGIALVIAIPCAVSSAWISRFWADSPCCYCSWRLVPVIFPRAAR